MERAGADIVGANCGAGIENMIEVTQLMRLATSLPIWCKPNAGLPEWVDGDTVYRETPEKMASGLSFVESGAAIVGGCCGTTPATSRPSSSNATNGSYRGEAGRIRMMGVPIFQVDAFTNKPFGVIRRRFAFCPVPAIPAGCRTSPKR